MTRVAINLDVRLNWELTLEEIIEKFPDEYEADKKEGLSDYQFVIRTFDNMGEDYFGDIFGLPEYDSDLEIEVY